MYRGTFRFQPSFQVPIPLILSAGLPIHGYNPSSTVHAGIPNTYLPLAALQLDTLRLGQNGGASKKPRSGLAI